MIKSCIEHDHFFDALEDISSGSDTASEVSEVRPLGDVLNSFHYDIWTENPRSVDERRDEFTRQTGFVIERCLTAREGPDDDDDENPQHIVGTSTSIIETVENGEQDLSDQIDAGDQLRISEGFNDGSKLDVDDVIHSGMPERLPQVGINKWLTVEQLEETLESSNLVPRIIRRVPKEGGDIGDLGKQLCDGGWLKKFCDKASTMFKKQRVNKNSDSYETVSGDNSHRVHVRSNKKWSKELSSLYRMQDFSAHQGSILAMKFSLDGEHLATGAEDGTLLVWKVIEDDSSTDFDILNAAPTSACLYFSVNGISNLASFHKIKEEGNVFDKLKRLSESACIMVPQKVFRILENPLHVLHGHEGEILDISWSKRGRLLSSSVDKTVRLWEVGSDSCLRVFPHSDYVTCAQFNPMDDSYFISGSIDGIVRIWEVLGCQVIDWIEIKEIVTAICYRPDGKGGIVGSMVGNCCFFEITGSLQPGSAIYLRGKKNLTCKRITGFQFSPSDSSEVAVSSAEPQLRILRGNDVISKFKGSLRLGDLPHGGSQIIASFTADGKHIISATDDSDVYIWNNLNHRRIPNYKIKTIWSSESFTSQNALIAVPWYGIRSLSGPAQTCRQHSTASHYQLDEKLRHESSIPLVDLCSLSRQFSSVSSTRSRLSSSRSSAGQPEQDNQRSGRSPSVDLPLPDLEDMDYEMLKTACDSILSGSHLWGLVIVTGDADGRIKTYHNYGLPVRYPRGGSLKSSFSFSSFKKRCTDKCNKLRSTHSFNDLFR